MKGLSELTDFYYKTLYPPLQKLEKDRKKLKNKILLYGGFYTTVTLFLAFYLLSLNSSIEPFLFLGFAYFGLGAFVYKWLIKEYTHEFKAKIIEPLIKEIDSNLSYTPKMHIPEQHFTRSKLFTSSPDRVSGNDYVRGKIDGIEIEFSDFHAQKKHKDSKGRTSWSTMFQGLFIISEFNKNFKGTTVVLPDTAESTFGNYIGSWLQSNNFGRNELIKMDNIAFEKEFVVYATDQIEARYILTPLLMQKLLNYKKRSKEDTFISFNANKIYLAIDYRKDLFEPSVFHSLLKYKIAMEYVETLHLAIGIVEELKLNQKLWSKL
jgi:hypothetical protein